MCAMTITYLEVTMNHLVLCAHPNPKSFNHAILETTVKTLESKGHEVSVRDLYELNFEPVLKGSDFGGISIWKYTSRHKDRTRFYFKGRCYYDDLSDLVDRTSSYTKGLYR